MTSQRVDPNLVKEMKVFGKGDWNACFHCGNCTAMCPLTEQGFLFPRKSIRSLQMGLEKSITGSTEPWLCYYCGECSETCPRDANPGELMMTLRRFLTQKYDWTGIANLFFKSNIALIIAFVLVFIGIIAVGFAKNFDKEAIMKFGHLFEQLTILGVFTIILIPNIIRMFWFTIVKQEVKAPLGSYITGFWQLIWNMFTQNKALKCETGTFRWFEHFLIVIGYLLLLFTTVVLDWFHAENPIIIWSGYIVGALVFIFTFDFVIGRLKKQKEVNKFSHPSDWLFVIWLFLLGFTAFLVRMFIDTGILDNNMWLYMVHLIIIAQWGLLLVPFGKWTHFLYRSFAIYFANLKKAELNHQENLKT
jgi:ferredoxin